MNEQRSYLMAYVFAFLSPILGILMGLYLYLRHDPLDQAAGVNCVWLSVWSTILWTGLALVYQLTIGRL